MADSRIGIKFEVNDADLKAKFASINKMLGQDLRSALGGVSTNFGKSFQGVNDTIARGTQKARAANKQLSDEHIKDWKRATDEEAKQRMKAANERAKLKAKEEAQEKAQAERHAKYLQGLHIRSIAQANREEAKAAKERAKQDLIANNQSRSFAQLEAQYSKVKTKQLIADIEQLVRVKKAAEQDMLNAATNAAKQEAARKRQIAQAELNSLNILARERPGVMYGGMGSSVGIQGVGRGMIQGLIPNMPAPAALTGVTSALSAMGPKGMLAAAAIGATGAAMKLSTAQAMDFEDALADLQAITGLTKEETAKLGVDSRQLAKEFGVDVVEILEATKFIVSSIGPDVAKNAPLLKQVTQDAMNLAKASNITSQEAANAITNTLGQFNLQTSESTRVANVLAKAAQVGNAEVNDLKDSFIDAGPIAAQAGMAVEQTAAAFETLGKVGIKGGPAGTALRGLLARLAGGSEEAHKALAKLGLTFNDINPSKVGLQQSLETLNSRFQQLKDPVEKDGIALKLFDTYTRSAASALMANTETLKDFTAEITGSNAVVEQANIKKATLSERLARIGQGFKDLGLSIGNSFTPYLSTALGWVESFVNYLPNISRALSTATLEIEKGISKANDYIAMMGLAIGFRTAKGVGQSLGNSAVERTELTRRITELNTQSGGGSTDGSNPTISNAGGPPSEKLTPLGSGGGGKGKKGKTKDPISEVLDEEKRQREIRDKAAEDRLAELRKTNENEVKEQEKFFNEEFERLKGKLDLDQLTEEEHANEKLRLQKIKFDILRELAVGNAEALAQIDINEKAAERERDIAVFKHKQELKEKELKDAEKLEKDKLELEKQKEQQYNEILSRSRSFFEADHEERKKMLLNFFLEEAQGFVAKELAKLTVKQATDAGMVASTTAATTAQTAIQGAGLAASTSATIGSMAAIAAAAAPAAAATSIATFGGSAGTGLAALLAALGAAVAAFAIKGFAEGGLINGPGSETSDSIPARLSKNEFVVKASSVRSVGADTLTYINERGELPPGFAQGGKVLDGIGSSGLTFTDCSSLETGVRNGKPYIQFPGGRAGFVRASTGGLESGLTINDCSSLETGVRNGKPFIQLPGGKAGLLNFGGDEQSNGVRRGGMPLGLSRPLLGGSSVGSDGAVLTELRGLKQAIREIELNAVIDQNKNNLAAEQSRGIRKAKTY